MSKENDEIIVLTVPPNYMSQVKELVTKLESVGDTVSAAARNVSKNPGAFEVGYDLPEAMIELSNALGTMKRLISSRSTQEMAGNTWD